MFFNGQVYPTDELLSAHVLFSMPVYHLFVCLFVVVVNTAVTASVVKLFSQKI
jgi:hypothetical protein